MAIENDRFANSATKNQMHPKHLITLEDLMEFRHLLLDDFKEILASSPQQTKKWLKSIEVRKLLNISSGTLQNLRIKGTVSYTKVGSIILYDNAEIENLLKINKVNNKVNNKPTLPK